jgi:small subunit ribosomal protein S12
MPTFNQLTKKSSRVKKKKRNRVLNLQKCPQKKGQVIRVFIRTPKKPSSGRRKIVRVTLTNFSKVNCHVPGMGGHNLQKFSTVLVRGCRVRDVPAMKYRVIRGKYDLKYVYERLSSRSKYGKKKILKLS